MPKLYFDLRIFGMQPFGGISTQWAAVLRRIEPRFAGFDVTLLLPNARSNIALREVSTEGFDVIPAAPIGPYRKYLPNSLVGAPDDVLHPSYYAWYPRFRGRRVVTVHDFNYELHPNPVIRFAHQRLLHDSVIRGDLIFCVSEFTRGELRKRYPRLDPARILVTPNGTDLRYETSGDGTGDYLLWVGGRGPTKRFDDALRFLALLPEDTSAKTRLVVVGQPFSDRERQRITEEDLWDRIDLRPRASPAVLTRLYGDAIALLYLSAHEGFGIPIIEAQACGCPVVARSIPVSREVGGESPLYLEDITTETVAGAWHRLRHPDSRQKMISVGRTNCTRYSWDDTVRTMVAAYSSLGNGGAHPA